MAENEPISIREFARRMGVSDTSVHKAIDKGKITPEALTTNPKNGRPMILPEIAAKNWADNHDPGKNQSPKLDSTLENHAKPRLSVVQKDKMPETKAAPPQTKNEQLPPAAPGQVEQNQASFNAAKRAKAIFEAKLKELEYKEKLGTLVDKDLVYRTFFEFGQVLRANLLTIPDRFIDEILSCKTRNEAHLLLQKVLNEELFLMTNPENINFKER